MDILTRYDHGIYAIDSGFGRPLLNAVHLIIEAGRAAIIDSANNAAVPRVMAVLAQLGIAPEEVDYVIATHIHLDHAGGVGGLLARLPHARLVVHPRGARHMTDPARLIESTIAVYGPRAAAAMYGEILPVDPARLIQTQHSMELALAGRKLRFIDTPGHARHHHCVVDAASGHIFGGDTFGLSYREWDRDGHRFVFPSTTPVQFDPPALHRSVDLLASYHPEAIYVTHYSQVTDIPRLADDLHRLIDAHAGLALAARGADGRHQRLAAGVAELMTSEAAHQGWALQGEALLALLKMDVELNAQGLGAWLDSLPP